MAEWSFQRKLISGVLLVCILAVLTSLATLISARILVGNMTRVSSGEGYDLAQARAIQIAGNRTIANAHACLLTGGAKFAPATREGSRRVREQALALLGHVAAERKAGVAAVLETEQQHHEAFERALADLSAVRVSSVALRAGAHLDSVLALGVRFDQALVEMVADCEAARGRSVLPARRAVNRAQTVMVAVNIVTVALLVMLCLVLVAVLNHSYQQQTVARRAAEHGQSQARESLTVAEAASQLKDEFLATVSHELRNPLAPILTWTQLLRSGKLNAEKTSRALEVIERNVLSQAQLIDDLVDVSRVVSGKFRLDVRPIDLVGVIRAAADAHGPASEAKNIRMQFVLDDRAGMISGDSERLQQVMWNLISNSIKFTPKGGRVQVVLQRVESHVEVTVSDTGVGISPDFLPHVFEPFRQGTVGPMRRHSGLGLGLSIVRHIVELHGGEITAESAGTDQGSRFTLIFPQLAAARVPKVAPKAHPVARDTLAEPSFGQLVGMRVLVVDDEPNASEALVVLFESCGAEARSASSVAEAMTMFAIWTPDVLVSDIAMPEEDGYALIRRVRALPDQQGGSTPAVALTAHGKIEDRVTILNAGFQMYLAKPADPNELVAVLASLSRNRGFSATS